MCLNVLLFLFLLFPPNFLPVHTHLKSADFDLAVKPQSRCGVGVCVRNKQGDSAEATI